MHIETERVKPVTPPPIKAITITLTEDEAKGLYLLLGKIGGEPKFYRTRVLTPLYDGLDKIFMSKNGPEHIFKRVARLQKELEARGHELEKTLYFAATIYREDPTA